MRADYNDVPMWEYRDLPRVFGAGKRENEKLSPWLKRGQTNGHANGVNGTKQNGNAEDYPIYTASAKSWGELWSVVADPQFNTPHGLKIVEIFMGWEDAPETLKVLVSGAAKRNQGRKGEVKKGMGEINGKPEISGNGAVVGGTTGNVEHDEVVHKVVSGAS